ncbi:MAG: M1 family metallopeptidase [Gemmatimonadota bacterium]
MRRRRGIPRSGRPATAAPPHGRPPRVAFGGRRILVACALLSPGALGVPLAGTSGWLGGARAAAAQGIPATLPFFHNAKRFAPLDLPPPDAYRGANGAPGDAYWQQRADYRIRAELDPRKRRLAGRETIRYTNNSPDSLRSLWLQLDQNLFRLEGPEAGQVPEGARFSGAFRGGGYEISGVLLHRDGRRIEVARSPEGAAVEGEEGVAANGPSMGLEAGSKAAPPGGPTADPGGTEGSSSVGRGKADGSGEKAVNPASYHIRGTLMEVRLDAPLPPGGGQLELELEFAFTVPEHGADRMGWLKVKKGTIYELAQWYPRMFVYDDLNGWNNLPYLGQGEFYLEYGDFDVELTLPRDFVVVATGVLQNPEEVYTAEQVGRLARARESAETVTIIDAREVGRAESRPAGDGPLTWRFRAEEVRDFAWAASEAFVLDGAGWNDVLILSAYPREAIGQFLPGWERSTQIVRHSVQHYSEMWSPYPYPVAINVAGTALGMEYPMIVFCTYRARGNGLFQVTDHEISHAWFPMLVGSDERRHAWMDEGFATFMNVYSEEAFLGERTPGNFANPDIVGRQMAADSTGPIMDTMPDEIREDQLGYLAYGKPGAMLTLLRDYILGPERFDPAFRAYIERWTHKHPQPADFIRTFEDVAGVNLDWFWRGWIFQNADVDLAVAAVQRDADTTLVTIENRGGIPMPLELRFIYEDGTDECHRLPVGVWLSGDRWTTRVVGKPVKNVQVDPRGKLPEAGSANNVWGRGLVIRRSTC